jgi:hypothetical protein
MWWETAPGGVIAGAFPLRPDIDVLSESAPTVLNSQPNDIGCRARGTGHHIAGTLKMQARLTGPSLSQRRLRDCCCANPLVVREITDDVQRRGGDQLMQVGLKGKVGEWPPSGDRPAPACGESAGVSARPAPKTLELATK